MKFSAGFKAQVVRALRVFAATFAATYFAAGTLNPGKSAIIGGIVAAFEVAVRTVWPTVPSVGLASGVLGQVAAKVVGVKVTPVAPTVPAPTVTVNPPKA
jgi:hypothetical protein